MSEIPQEVPEGVDPETGEVIEPEAEPIEQEAPEADAENDGRCEAETTAGGNVYRCSLQEGHGDAHSFQGVDADDAEPTEEQVAAFTEQELAKMQGKLDNENERHRKRVAEIVGDGASDLLPCPLCSGWIDGTIPPVQPPDEIVTAVKQTLGLASNDDFQTARHAHRCEDCAGFGCVISGSLVPGNEVVSCPKCNGSGFVLNHAQPQPAGMAPPPPNGGEVTAPPGLNPDDPFMVEARARGMMVLPLPTMPDYEDAA